jgi:hypothetical protein
MTHAIRPPADDDLNEPQSDAPPGDAEAGAADAEAGATPREPKAAARADRAAGADVAVAVAPAPRRRRRLARRLSRTPLRRRPSLGRGRRWSSAKARS